MRTQISTTEKSKDKSSNLLKGYLLGVLLLSSLMGTPLYAKEVSLVEARRIQYQPIVLKPTLPACYLQTGNSRGLEKAYQRYLQTGEAPNIITSGFVQFAYGASQPIVPTRPFELSVISLEPGEQVTSVSCGDPLRWSYALAYSGSKIRQAHVMVKPSLPHLSTDLVITTDKRFYTLKLLSKQSSDYYRDVRFWYPMDIEQQVRQAMHQEANSLKNGDSPSLEHNQLDVAHLNFNYTIKCPFFGEKPTWYPSRVFDDGRQTYIQFPPASSQSDLPALFIQTHQHLHVTNFRVKAPYFIVDSLFERAVLVSGVGKNQVRLLLMNHGYRQKSDG
jgi:P-type conjugative transfer protein TrbG